SASPGPPVRQGLTRAASRCRQALRGSDSLLQGRRSALGELRTRRIGRYAPSAWLPLRHRPNPLKSAPGPWGRDNGPVRESGPRAISSLFPAAEFRLHVSPPLKLILEPIFEADFQSGSYGYRPKRTAHQAVNRVAQAIVESKTRIIDLDLRAYFDNVQHYLLLEKVARRVQDEEVMHLLKMMLKATGERAFRKAG